jgi:hypothetical protein
MRELVVRAHLLRAALGDPDGAVAARTLATDIDNPALTALTLNVDSPAVGLQLVSPNGSSPLRQ